MKRKRPRNYQVPDQQIVTMVRAEHPNICYDAADKARVKWYSDHARMFGRSVEIVVAMACNLGWRNNENSKR